MTTQIPSSMLASPGGGAVQSGALAASTTVAPNATAVQNAIAAAASGAAAVRTAETPLILLDITGSGRAMPLVAGATISISADYTPTRGAGEVLNGVTVADYLSTGVGNLILTSFNARGDTFAAEANRLFTVTYYKQTSGAFAVVQKGDLIPATVPNPVTGLTLGAATNTTQPLTWTAPAYNGGSALTDYLIEYKLAAAGTYTAFTHTASTVTAIVVTGLTASSSYNFRVSAVNLIGTGAPSAVMTGSTGAAAATYVIEDLFNNRTIVAAGPINTIGARSDGGAWTVTGGASWDVNSTIAGSAFTNNTGAQIRASVGHPDTVVEVLAVVNGYPWIGVRSVDATSAGQVTVLFSPTVTEVRNSAGTIIGSDATANPAGLQAYSAEVTGATIVAKVNGVVRVTATLAGVDLTGTFVSWNPSPSNPNDQIRRFRAT